MRPLLAVVCAGAVLVPAACGDRENSATVGQLTAATASSTTALPTTTRGASDDVALEAGLVADAALFVSMNYPTMAMPGTTVRFVVTCDRPLGDEDGYEAGLYVMRLDVTGLDAFGADLTYVGSTFYYDWAIPSDQPLGDYGMVARCDGPSDVIEPDVTWPDGVASPLLTFSIVAELPPTR